jgi:hypothetical protein
LHIRKDKCILFTGCPFSSLQARREEDFYTRPAKKVEEDLPRKILIYLSKMEHSYLKILEGEFSIALNYEDYAERPADKGVT